MITAATAHIKNALSISAYIDILRNFLTLQIKIELANQDYWIINLPLPVAIPLFNTPPPTHTHTFTHRS